MKTRTAHDVEAQSIATWRRERLVESGLPLPLATCVSMDARYDVHALIELVERGCDPELAIRILAPLEDAA